MKINKRILVLSIAILLLAVSTSASAGYPDRYGTVAYWTFDEGSGTIAHDISGNGNDGNIYGASWTSGKVGGALSFDGSNDYVKVPDSTSLDIAGEITIEEWIKINEWNGEWGEFGPFKAEYITGTGWIGNYWISSNQNPTHYLFRQWTFAFTNPDGTIRECWSGSNGLLELGTWIYLVATYDGNVAKLYQNGKLVSTCTIGYALQPNDKPLTLGGSIHNGALYSATAVNCFIDEVRILNRSLTPEEILEDYKSTKQLFLTTNQANYTLGDTVNLSIVINYTEPSVFASFKLELQEPSGMLDTIIQTKLFALNPGFYKKVTLSYPIPVNMWISDGEYSFTGSLIDSFGNIIESDSARFYINDSMPAGSNLNII